MRARLALVLPLTIACAGNDKESTSSATGTDGSTSAATDSGSSTTGGSATSTGTSAGTGSSSTGSGSTTSPTGSSTSTGDTSSGSTGGGGLGPYGACSEDRECPVADSFCLDGTVCAPPCNPPDQECPSIDGGTPLCVFSTCQLQCTTDDDCPDGMVCGGARCDPG